MEEVFRRIVEELKKYNFVISTYHSYTTSSIYIKLDYGVANGIRIADHKGKKKYKYRYNVMNDLEADYMEKDGGYERFYYRPKHIGKMINKIVTDKEEKMKKYGIGNYLKYMKKESHSKVNQRFKEEKRRCGIPVLIYGRSGSGKSTSLRNFGKNEILLINVEKKPLPFKGKFEDTLSTDDYREIVEKIKGTDKKVIVIDDAGYLITNHFMKKHSSCGGGNGVFALYNDIGDYFWNLIEFVKKQKEDTIIYFIMHEDQDEFGKIKLKTIGKLLDEKVCIEGMCTIALRCFSENGKHFFKTKTDGIDITKTPLEMFDTDVIDNDLKMVDTKIREYYEFK